jgi:hypothetical protein
MDAVSLASGDVPNSLNGHYRKKRASAVQRRWRGLRRSRCRALRLALLICGAREDGLGQFRERRSHAAGRILDIAALRSILNAALDMPALRAEER